MEIEELAKRVAVALATKEYTMCTAEECTCGLVGASIASQDYAQKYYKGTITTYTQESLEKVLNVPSYVIERNDLVSCQVAQQMALETLYKFNVDIATSVVGYVEGFGSSDIAAGEVQICVAKYSHDSAISFKYSKIHVDGGDRGKNIEAAIKEALTATLEHIMS